MEQVAEAPARAYVRGDNLSVEEREANITLLQVRRKAEEPDDAGQVTV
jgi:hypothetical protein